MLKSVKIKGYRSCIDTVFDAIGPGPTALVGRNGAGKTNILTAIDALSDAMFKLDAHSSPFGFLSSHHDNTEMVAEFSLLKLEGKYEIKVSLDFNEIDNKKAPSLAVHELLNIDADGRAFEISRRNSRVTIKSHDRSQDLSIGPGVAVVPAIISLLPSEDCLIPCLHHLRTFFSSITYYDNIVPRRPSRSAWVEAKQYRQWKERYAESNELPDNTAFRILHMWQDNPDTFKELRDILGNDGLGLVSDIFVNVHKIQMTPSSDGSEESDENDSVDLYSILFVPGTEIAGGDHAARVTFGDLSEGTQRVIRLLTILLFDNRSVLLLEQLEDSLHPLLLQKLLDIIVQYSDQTQVLFSTHSPDVLDALSPSQIRVVAWEDGTTKCRPLSHIEIEAAHMYLTEEGSLSDFIESLNY